ncbi:MAG TPA: hypothetical protein VGR74_09655 [Actinomycetota bacterium]|nr:hypothetical protein [Actinomycetota bacterium]
MDSVEQAVRPLAGGPLLGLGMAGPGVLGQRRLDGQPGPAQLGDPVGLLGGGQDRQPVGHGGPGVGQAAVPQGGLGQAGEHRRGVLRVQRRPGVVEDAPEVGVGGGGLARAQPQRPPDGQR